VDGNEGKAGGDGEGATEMDALRAFAESVGYKRDIMDGVVTECAGGAIEEIHWRFRDLDGTLPVGVLNMPKLRVLDLSYHINLKGERERASRLRVRGLNSFLRLRLSPHPPPHPSFDPFPSFYLPFRRCCRQDRTPRGHAGRDLHNVHEHHRYS
jgi:hypothetical protein